MNSREILALALGLNDPWEIIRVDMTTTDNSVKELHLHIGLKAGVIFCDKDGNPCPMHDTKTKEWRSIKLPIICR